MIVPNLQLCRAHESEKIFQCSYCANRFKNKNEAERHQNTLHLRRQWWSCFALSDYHSAFHSSTNRPGQTDTCGYCGKDFARSGRAVCSENLRDGSRPKHSTDKDWELRIRHLQNVHNYRECDSAKRFYRTDHFRQHLKHSHAGICGKWMNMLGNACKVEEELPVPMGGCATWTQHPHPEYLLRQTVNVK